ncbi:MAG: NADH-quinone oxidoreductase subunit NuoE [Gammaproteobacteria bacterium]
MNTPAEQTLSEHSKREIDQWLSKFPPQQKQSAVLAALREVQHENNGYLTQPLMDAVADYLQMPKIAVYEVASFYSMLETRPCGRHSISVCTNISCMLRGADAMLQHIQHRFQLKPGESTADGRFYLKQEEECLAACCGAPMMMVDHTYHENLTTEKIDAILDALIDE